MVQERAEDPKSPRQHKNNIINTQKIGAKHPVKKFNLSYCLQKLSVMTLNHPSQKFVVSSQHESYQVR